MNNTIKPVYYLFFKFITIFIFTFYKYTFFKTHTDFKYIVLKFRPNHWWPFCTRKM